ncbi:MAG: hypothetical protein U0Q22_09805 [Acidimicrobiales bacterium]
MNLRRILVVLAASTMLLSACGGSDLPSKSDFIAQVKKSMGTDVTSTLEKAGIEKAKATEIVDNFVGCIYDKLKTDEKLLQQAYDDGGDKAVSAKVQEKAAACTASLTKAMTEAATAGS